MEPEQVNPELLEEALSDHPAKLRKLAEVIERTVNSETAKHNQQLFAEMERLNQSILDRLYEEELPETLSTKSLTTNLPISTTKNQRH